MVRSPEKTEIIKPEKFEVGGVEMLELSASNPQEFLNVYCVKPASELIAQNRVSYQEIVKKSERPEEEYEAFFDKWLEVIGYDPNGNPSNLPWVDKLRTKYRQMATPGFFQFTRKENNTETEGEVRMYLSVKQDYLLDFLENLTAELDEMTSLFAFKLNVSDYERNENVVLYLTEESTRAEIERLLEVLTNLRANVHNSEDIFNNYDFVTPFSQSITSSQSQNVIGQIAFNPFKSSKGKVELMDDIGGLGRARTVNELFSSLVGLVKAYHPESNPPEKIAQMLLDKAKIDCHFEDGGEDKTRSLIEYCQLCLGQISKILKT